MGDLVEFKPKEKVKTPLEKWTSGEGFRKMECAQCGCDKWHWTSTGEHVCCQCGQFIEQGEI